MTDPQISTALSKNHRGEPQYDLATAVIATASEMLITLFDWQHSARQRQQILGLSDSALKDFGASCPAGRGGGQQAILAALVTG